MTRFDSPALASGLLALGLATTAYAGNVQVTLKHGTLQVSGDKDAASLRLFGNLANELANVGFVDVHPNAGTVNGSGQDATFTGVLNIRVSVKNGGNTLAFDQLQLSGGIQVSTGSGDDEVTVTDTTLSEDLSVNGGNGVLTFTCSESVMGRDLVVKSGAGDDVVDVDCGAARNGKISVGNGFNAVSVTLAHPFSFTNLSIQAGNRADLVLLSDSGSHTSVTGDLKIDLGGDGNEAQASRFQVAGNFSYKGGGGVDAILGDPLAVGGDMRLSLGGGDNSVQLTDSHVIGQLRVSAGAGDDTVVFMGTTTAGSTKFQLGGGANQRP
ncbi:MAG TPA: hypothetical protein VMR50_00065 [Myxococcota bacterium]|nr:hypothetical protein [Myxococcota bacterium]